MACGRRNGACAGFLDEVDFVVGAFSKSFATTGGFLATRSASVHEFVRMFGGPQTFSSALTPVQTAVAHTALGIIRSPEGAVRRKAVAAVAQRLRDGLEARGHPTMGDVLCPVVPVFIGTTATGLASARQRRTRQPPTAAEPIPWCRSAAAGRHRRMVPRASRKHQCPS